MGRPSRSRLGCRAAFASLSSGRGSLRMTAVMAKTGAGEGNRTLVIIHMVSLTTRPTFGWRFRVGRSGSEEQPQVTGVDRHASCAGGWS